MKKIYYLKKGNAFVKLTLFVFSLVIINNSNAQTHIEKKDLYQDSKSLNLGVGYSYSFGSPHNKDFHLINLEINKTKYNGIAGYQYGGGTEVVLNPEKFTIAPKINGVLYYQFIVLGAELVSYTDFGSWNLRFVPMFGIGMDRFRLTINPQVKLLNKNYQPINEGLLNLTINLRKNKTTSRK